jgi:hypothetical protein
MKLLSFLMTILLITGIYSFSVGQNNIIGNCYINFNKASKLSMASPERLPDVAKQGRKLQTEAGEVNVTTIDGYSIDYNNRKKAPFVNLKVELSDPDSYGADTTHILQNLKYLNSKSQDMETSELIKLDYNGYTFYGLSRNTIEKGSTLGVFVMFPGNNIIVYFYFNNLKPEIRNFKSVDDYKSQRNDFFGAYTNHLNSCVSK